MKCQMARTRGIEQLSNELIREIIDHIAADPGRLVPVDKREYLSQESFKPPPLPSRDQAEDIGSLRLTCKRFADLGALQQFSRITTRFSAKGFQRLERISEQPHLTRHVKKFSYMVPCFYSEGQQPIQDLNTYLTQAFGQDNVSQFRQKIRDQQQLIRSEEDLRVLKKAILAFSALQHVQILRVQDRDDEKIINFVREHNGMHRFIEIQWGPACLHSTRTIGMALAAARSPISRFSSPMLNPQSALKLAQHPPSAFSSLANRLTCLELHFDDGFDLDIRMEQLSDAFRTVFTAARNLEAVHVGFPSHRPLSLPLEAVFHNVVWKRLVAFGVQGWRLHADEIIDFARRHCDQIRGLRLRDVLLQEDSMWKDVLGYLHDNMTRLDWVSLRRIGYARQFDQYWQNAGIEVPDDPPGGISDSDDEADDLYEPDDDHQANGRDLNDGDQEDSDVASESEGEHSDDEHGPHAHEMDFPPLNSPNTPNSVPWCNCDGRNYPDNIDDLGDDGMFVDNTKRKMWEQWVLHKCPEHSLRD